VFSNGIMILLFLLSMEVVMLGQYDSTSRSEAAKFPWPEGKKCAVSLSFDDARPSQLDNGIPILNQHGMKATFFISPNNLELRLDDWKKVVSSGHEIGNHSMTHPCSGNFTWSRDNALENHTIDTIRADLESANRFLQEKLGIVPVSFAYPCGQKFVGRGEAVQSYVPVVLKLFHSGRGWLDESSNSPRFVDFGQVLGMELDGLSFEEAKTLIDKAAEEGHWLVLCGHDIGDAAPQTTLSETLESICQYVSAPENAIWMDTIEKVGAFIRKNR
jgi:peptidoglycan/xylan/chitin deacetylase (PgdA/CDA1 family)